MKTLTSWSVFIARDVELKEFVKIKIKCSVDNFPFVLQGLLITEKMNDSFDAKKEIYDL